MPGQKQPLSASGSVRLGLFASAKDAGAYPDEWMNHVCREIEEAQVRYICGVFWCGKEETETLFKRLHACENGIFFQPVWTGESHDGFNDDEMAAVAARFGVVPQNASYIVVYPAYLVVLGPSKEVTRPEFWRQPSWNDR